MLLSLAHNLTQATAGAGLRMIDRVFDGDNCQSRVSPPSPELFVSLCRGAPVSQLLVSI